MSNTDFGEARQKVQLGLLQGNLRHMVDRVDGFKKQKQEQIAAGKGRIRTKETARQEAEAKELEKFINFCDIFGEFRAIRSHVMGEAGVLSAPKEWKYDISEYKQDGKEMQEIRYRNIQLWWPLRILQQVYAWSERKVLIHAG